MGREPLEALRMLPTNLTKAELERYSRQILLLGGDAQRRLKNAHVLVVGAGGLGATTLPLLAASGVGCIEIFDGDAIETSNLGRQWIYSDDAVGKNKASEARAFLQSINPHIEVIAHDSMFEAGNFSSLEKITLVCEGSDNLASKFAVNDLALRAKVSAVISSLAAAQGHTMLVNGVENACYRCVFDEVDQSSLPSCAGEGILTTFVGFIAAHAAHTAITQIIATDREAGFWVFEKNHCRSVRIKRRIDCIHHNIP